MIVYTAMSPKAIEKVGWKDKVAVMLNGEDESGYQKIEPDDFTGGDLFPPYVMRRITAQLDEQGLTDSSLWSNVSWSVGYSEEADVVYFRLEVL